MSEFTKEERRIQEVYSKRKQKGASQLYSWCNDNTHLAHYRQNAIFAQLLKQIGKDNLKILEFLDVGCGHWDWLRILLGWGASPERLHGIDLLEDRIAQAKNLAPNLQFRVATGWEIPFPNDCMDVVSANTVFSSVLDTKARQALASEMLRVVKPDGGIAIYDFFISHPRNPDTVGIGSKEISRLFPGMNLKVRTLTLAPPIARRIVPWSPLLAHVIEVLIPFFRTHALYFLTHPKAEHNS